MLLFIVSAATLEVLFGSGIREGSKEVPQKLGCALLYVLQQSGNPNPESLWIQLNWRACLRTVPMPFQILVGSKPKGPGKIHQAILIQTHTCLFWVLGTNCVSLKAHT